MVFFRPNKPCQKAKPISSSCNLSSLILNTLPFFGFWVHICESICFRKCILYAKKDYPWVRWLVSLMPWIWSSVYSRDVQPRWILYEVPGVGIVAIQTGVAWAFTCQEQHLDCVCVLYSCRATALRGKKICRASWHQFCGATWKESVLLSLSCIHCPFFSL